MYSKLQLAYKRGILLVNGMLEMEPNNLWLLVGNGYT